MKRWTYIVAALLVSTVALSACGKKGGGGNAAPPATGADVPPGQQVNTNRGHWDGPMQIVDAQLLRKLLRKAGACQNNCQIEGMFLNVRVLTSVLPGMGEFTVKPYRNGQWRHRFMKRAQALPHTNGFQLVQNMDGGGWWGGGHGGWNHGGKVCYWRQVAPQNNGGWWIGGSINTGNGYIGGSFQQGTQPGQAQWVCENQYHTMNNSVQADQSMGPQVIDPNHSQQNFWIGNQVQIIAEYKDASKTCIVVKLYYQGQLVAQGEINGVVY